MGLPVLLVLIILVTSPRVRVKGKTFNSKLFQQEYQSGLTPEAIATLMCHGTQSKIVKKVDTDKIHNLFPFPFEGEAHPKGLEELPDFERN